MAKYLAVITTTFILILSSQNVLAHSGRTNSSGCHNCNVGSCAGTYHCHNGGTPSYSNNSYYVPTTPTCGLNAYYSSVQASCTCRTGYTPSPDNINCVVLPANAYPVDSATDAWLCNSGYKEVGDKCIKDPSLSPPVVPNKIQNTTTNYDDAAVPMNSTGSDDLGSLVMVGLGVVGGIGYLWDKRKH